MQSPHCSQSGVKQMFKIVALLILTLVLTGTTVSESRGAQDDADRKRAFQLYKDAKFQEALPLFEKLEKTYPDDPEVLERYGLMMIGQNVYLKDPAARKDARKRGRDLLIRAQKAGADDALLKAMLDGIPPDGGNDTTFSTKKEVDDAMRAGEEAFMKGEFPKAVEMYQQALLLDPNLYEAALFTGDVYFKSAEQRKAGEWFARAIQINPDRETAYRYWGDSLMKQGRVTEAGDKFVEAYLAEPYSRLARAGILNWGNKINVQLAHPNVEIPTNVVPKANGDTTINLDPNVFKKDDKSGAGAAWMVYGLIRAGWVSKEFSQQYPSEKTYRHSLKEEVSAFRAALKVLGEQKNVDPKDSDPSLKAIAKLDKEGLLESFVLLAMPDQGIAQDYATYRKDNIDKLRKYVMDYVLTGGAGKN